MTRRLTLFLLFLLLAGLLAPASVSGATVSYYGLSFDRTGYISTTTTESFSQGLTIVALVRFEGIPNDTASYDWMAIATKKSYTNDWGLLQEVKSTSRSLALFVNGTRVVSAQDSVENGCTYLIAASYDGSVAKLYLNGNLLASNSISMQIPDNYNDILIGNSNGRYPFGGEIYLVLIYNRALSDSEIQAIYQDPLNPPLDGLVLWYAPDSVDPAANVWHDKSGNGNDGSIYGATPERVSIPSASYYNAVNSSPIPVENVSVAMTHNNTTIGLIPSFLTLPWNQTVTLNVSAVGYESRTLSILTTINSLAVYLIPAPSNGTTTSPPNWTNNFTMPDINGTWSGWQIGKEALSLNFDKAIQMFFTENPNSQAQAFLPFAIWIGMTILGLVFSQSPLVALTLGVITQASLAGLGAKVDMRLLPGVVTLYLFLFIWILKDFIESRKAD